MGIKSTEAILLGSGLVPPEKVLTARKEAARLGISLVDTLVKLRIASEEELAYALASGENLPCVKIEDYVIDPKVIALINKEVARRLTLIPLFLIDKTLTIAMADPGDTIAIDEAAQAAGGINIDVVIATKSEIHKGIDEYYETKSDIQELIDTIDPKKVLEFGEEEGGSSSIIELVDLIFAHGVRERASDIFIEPDESHMEIRYRVDGIISQVATASMALFSAISSRIKIMSLLDVAEKRLSQDGRLSFKAAHKEMDVRVGIFPTVFGENIVMRLLEKSATLVGGKELGFSSVTEKKVNALISKPYGMLVVTGPVGSGKTTTLYTILNELADETKNTLTIEDPVEYNIAHVRQSQVNKKIGHTFPSALRSMLRQAPDIIMVGEMRDSETAELATEAALTGQLVLTTLHTNDAPSAIMRLIDMGIEPYLLSSTLIGVISQRLMRKICKNCQVEDETPASVREKLGLKEDIKTYKGKGCFTCRKTGYKGRIGVFEVFTVNSEIEEAILSRATSARMRKIVIQSGMQPLIEDGIEKITEGITTVEELLRVTGEGYV
ncbi:MAG: putative type II secretion system protein HxcR [Syntrophomonadaceae bacterium]|nr:putative type II secretion system protein HxcR [Bacillota bacterium]